jgi:hypothetical protein
MHSGPILFSKLFPRRGERRLISRRLGLCALLARSTDLRQRHNGGRRCRQLRAPHIPPIQKLKVGLLADTGDGEGEAEVVRSSGALASAAPARRPRHCLELDRRGCPVKWRRRAHLQEQRWLVRVQRDEGVRVVEAVCAGPNARHTWRSRHVGRHSTRAQWEGDFPERSALTHRGACSRGASRAAPRGRPASWVGAAHKQMDRVSSSRL